MKGSILFDCEWLLRFQKLHTLYLGKKAKKHIEKIAELPKLKNLKIRGIKLKSLEFLKELNLESLSILWCGMNDLSLLSEFKSLKYLELWRIMKLEDISFLSELSNLEKLVLQDLNHIHELPDLSLCHRLKEIQLINIPIHFIPKELESIVKRGY